jgi:hypothetical protein
VPQGKLRQTLMHGAHDALVAGTLVSTRRATACERMVPGRESIAS